MRSKKLNTNSFHVRKTRINRKNTFRTKKRVKRFTQKNKRALQYGGQTLKLGESGETSETQTDDDGDDEEDQELDGNLIEEEEDDGEELTEEEQQKAEAETAKVMEEPRELTTIEKAVKARKIRRFY